MGLFDSVFHEVNDAIAIVMVTEDNNGPVVIDANHEFEQLTGYWVDEVTDMDLLKLLDDTAADTRPILEEAFEERQTAVVNSPCVHKDGNPLPLNITVRPITAEKDINRFICVLRPQGSEDSHVAAAAREAKRKLLAAMHHTFRTPLNGILGFSEIIKDELLGPVGQDSYKQYAKDIHGAGQDMLQLIDHLLDLKKLELAELELSEESFDLAELLGECLDSLREDAQKADVKLSRYICRDLPNVNGDRVRFRKIITSLLFNALKFTPSGNRVMLKARLNEGGTLIISCQDEGTGMRPQQVAKAFSHDNQFSDIYADPNTGLGFGLPYVKKMIEQHNGTVSIASRYGQGTTVNLHLPASRLL